MKTRLYHVIAVNDKTGAHVIMTRPLEPVTHAEAVTIRSKLTNHPARRLVIEEA